MWYICLSQRLLVQQGQHYVNVCRSNEDMLLQIITPTFRCSYAISHCSIIIIIIIIIIIYISLPSGIRPRVRLVSVKVYTYTCTVSVIHCSNSCSLPRGLCGLSQLLPLLAILGLFGCYFAAHGIYCLSPCHSPSSVFHPITCSKKHFSC